MPSADDVRTADSELAERLVAGGVLLDPWLDGELRIRAEPVRLSLPDWARLRAAAEDVASVYAELCGLCAAEPAHADELFGLSPCQKLMWLATAPDWHGFARADLFLTASGIVCCELNSDTPTGQVEAVLLNQAVADAHPGTLDPNARLEAAFCSMLEQRARHVLGDLFERAVGIVYPTELTEDLSLVHLYRRWLEARGYTVVLGSPYNLTLDAAGTPYLFDTPCPVVVRHYKTDWWGEREPVWGDDDDFDDPDPLTRPLGVLLTACLEGRCAVVNPFGAVLPQNKKAMAFMWEHIGLFSESSQSIIREHIPYTVRLEALHPAQLLCEREDWVLKSDYGCEGNEVVIGRDLTDEQWEEALAQASPGRWIAQRYFEALATPGGETVNHGVYVIGGQAAGIYCRSQKGATDFNARSVPCLVARDEEEGP